MTDLKEATDWDIRITHFGGGRNIVTILYENVPQCSVSFRTLPAPIDYADDSIICLNSEEIKHINRANKQSERLAVERALEKIRSPQWQPRWQPRKDKEAHHD